MSRTKKKNPPQKAWALTAVVNHDIDQMMVRFSSDPQQLVDHIKAMMKLRLLREVEKVLEQSIVIEKLPPPKWWEKQTFTDRYVARVSLAVFNEPVDEKGWPLGHEVSVETP